MSQPTITVVRSLPKFLARIVLFPVCVAAAVWGLLGVGVIMEGAVAAAIALSVICFLAMAITQRPRVCITPDGFSFCKLIGTVTRSWRDIDESFAVIKIGWSEAVAYKLSANGKTRLKHKPTSHLSGYDEAIVGVFAISAAELAALLNEQQRKANTPPS